ncbi:MAG: GNAT family protein [Chloroflexota bacterium]
MKRTKKMNRVSETPHADEINHSRILIRRKRLADAWNDYNWEKDPELAYLDAIPPLEMSFNQYLLEYTEQLGYHSSTRNRFAVETQDGRHIGNCSYYNIDEAKGETELGIMIGDRICWDKGYGQDIVTALVDYIFRKTGIKRIYLKTLDTNSRAHKCFQKRGFVPYGHRTTDGFNFTLMELYRDWWERTKSEYRDNPK